MSDKDDEGPIFTGEEFFSLKPGEAVDNSNSIHLTEESLEKIVPRLYERLGEGDPFKIEPYQYPPVSLTMKRAMDRAGWGESEVAEFFAGLRRLPNPDGEDWVYGPAWDLVHSGGSR